MSTSDVSTETNLLPVSCMVTAESKVAPLNPVTVPRQELMGAILVLGLTQSVLKDLEEPMQNDTFHSDSIDVLWWIRGRGKDLVPLADNLIGELQMLTDPLQR